MTATMTMLDHALAFRERGWRPFPLDHPGLARCAGLHGPNNPCPGGDKRGKHPAVKYGTACASEAPDKLLAHWFSEPRNIGLACGPSGLVVADEDELNALAKLAADLGEELPITYRTRTQRGWHWYFEAPDDIVIGNRSGRLAEYCIDVRGGKGKGGYVVAAGSLHVSGHVYVAEDPYVLPAPFPRWLIPEIQNTAKGEDDTGARTAWDDEARYGTELDLRAQYARHVEEIRHRGDEFRHELFRAARDGYRLVTLGLLDMATLAEDLRVAVYRVWGAAPDERDKVIVNTEARQAADRSPWLLISTAASVSAAKVDMTGSAEGDAVESEQGPEGEEIAAAVEARLLEEEVRRARRKKSAQRILSAEDREPVRVLSGLAFLAGEDLEYLVPNMLYRASTAKVFGPPGGTKTFLLLDLALSLATGRPWQGQQLGRHQVHYVMAEGEPMNRLRTRGWLQHHDVDAVELEGWLTVVPQGVLLTPEGVTDYLIQVESDQPALVILDTKNAMMEGKEESATDTAVMIRAMRSIRDAAAGACVCLVDHTGLNDETRGRGSGAVTAAMDTEIIVNRDASGLATAKVTRDKGAEVGTAWYYRLRTVDDVPRKSGIAAPAVCVPAQRADASDPFDMSEDWAEISTPLPDDVATYKGKGARAVPALARFMRYSASSGSGFSLASAKKALRTRYRDDRGRPMWSDDTIERAWDALSEAPLARLALGAAKGSPATWLARDSDPS